jgi:1-deoxy-D-xylulose-5-phosphate reductoisomerase
VVGGAEGVNAVATEAEANVVVTGIVGCAGLLPTIEAIKVKKREPVSSRKAAVGQKDVGWQLKRQAGVRKLSQHISLAQYYTRFILFSKIQAKKRIALANKETLIAGGPVILPLLQQYGVTMTPADSEHSAIFQALQGVPPGGMRKVRCTPLRGCVFS